MDAGPLVAVPASVPTAVSLPMPIPAACSPGPRTPLSPVPLPVPLPIASTTSSMIPLKLDTPKPVYSSPPPASSSPENNTCRMIEYRGAKVAAFNVDGRELICLPQAFDLFLKHLVGGLHTVYTKLKRLDITPIVCNVEQVRILRGLGAIQPGVNRCKLISPKEFDVLYEDCTNSSARPGRPPKRSPSMTATPETLEKLKKSRMDNGDYPGYHHPRLLVPPPSMFADPKKSPLFSNGYHYPPHLAASLPFMHLGHPMMSMAMAGHLGMRPDGSIIRERPTENDLSSPRTREDQYHDGLTRYEDNNNKPLDKPLNLEIDKQRDRRPSNTDKESGMSTPSEYMANGQLDLSTKVHHAMHCGNDDMTGDDDSDDDKEDDEMSNSDVPHQTTQNGETSTDKPNLGNYSHLLNTENSGISSIETLLMNIQGLLKVASENARHRERQMNYEKAELKMELMREREVREGLEKQLMDEHRNRAGLVKRLKKEKKARRKLQDQLEMGGVKPLPAEDPMERTSPDNLRLMSDSLGSHVEQTGDRDCPLPPDTSDRRLPDARSGLQNLMDTFLGQQSKSCGSAANGYIHSPVIKQTESV